MITTINNKKIYLIDEPSYTLNSTDNIRKYNKEIHRDGEFHMTCAHGLISPITSIILLGNGGTTGIHNNSLAYKNDLCFIAVSDSVFAMTIPKLEVKWFKKVDLAACFGIYYLPEKNCLISWGEVNIVKLALNGTIIWSCSGADIFTGNFKIFNHYIEVIDFNNQKYMIDLDSGKINFYNQIVKN